MLLIRSISSAESVQGDRVSAPCSERLLKIIVKPRKSSERARYGGAHESKGFNPGAIPFKVVSQF